MAATSAGTIQQAVPAVSVSGSVGSQMVNTIQQHHLHQLHQQPTPQHIRHHHQQRQLMHQRQSRALHHSSVNHQTITHQTAAVLSHQNVLHQSFLPRAGNDCQQITHGAVDNAVSNVTNINADQKPEQQHQKQHSTVNNNQRQQHALSSNVAKQQEDQIMQSIQQRSQSAVAANLAPGWRRLFSNNEIIYVSPSGVTLSSHSQIQDYLLSHNTCKCGLPCPLRPKYFFDFNSQVPTILFQMPLENELPAGLSLVCNHQRKHYQQNIHKDMKSRKLSDLVTISTSGCGKISTSPVPQCNSVTDHSGNAMHTSQTMTTNNRGSNVQQIVVAQPSGQLSNISTYQLQHTLTQDTENEKQIGSVTLSKTPPWRKNSISQQQSQAGQNAGLQQQFQTYGVNTEQMPSLRQSHLQQKSQDLIPPWQQQLQQPDLIQTRIVKGKQLSNVNTASISKKRPNFKDDPTGYLDQQTAILHSSILNVVSSLDLHETPLSTSSVDCSYDQYARNDNLQDADVPIKGEQQHSTSVIQPNLNLCRDHLSSRIESKLQPTLAVKHQSQSSLQTAAQPNLYQQNQSRMVPSQIVNKSRQQLPHVQQQALTSDNQLIPQHSVSQGQPIIATNFPSSQHQQPFLVTKQQQQANHNPNHTDQLLRNPDFLSEADQQKATTTTIGGQTVTHFPNGMVKIEQNCDNNNIIIPLKPQQHVQLQHQIHQHNMLFRQSQQFQKLGDVSLNSISSSSTVVKLPTTCHISTPENNLKVGVSSESPVSSSTTFGQVGSDLLRLDLDNKGPAQVGAISTSNENPITCHSATDSESNCSTIKSISSSTATALGRSVQHQQRSTYGTPLTTSRNTITSVQAGRANTATTTSTTNERSILQSSLKVEPIQSQEIQYHSQKLSPNNLIPVSSTISSLQLQPAMREPGNQLIMTSTGQLIVMPAPTQPCKTTTNQVIINSPNENALMHSQSVSVINQQANLVNSVDMTNSTTNHIIQNSPNGLVIQNAAAGLVQPSAGMIQQAGGNLIGQNGHNFIMNSTGNGIQPMLLNNSNLIQQSNQNLNLIQTGSNGAKVISNSGGIFNQSGNLMSPNNSGLIGQQTVVLNTLPNGYVIQPNFTAVDSQVVSQLINQDSRNPSYLQQQQTRQIILTSPDSKRKAKKRKNSASSSPSTPSSLSPQQSPNIQHQQQQSSMVQITPQYPSQGFQIGPGIQGIAVVNKGAQPVPSQQQIIFQNGQIIQPMNIIGQQLLVPAGLVVAPDTTLLQIQNIGPCGNIITPQGVVLRAPSPQNKNFLSTSGPAGQQFIVSGNNQMSPLGQIYGTPVSLVVPQSNSASTTATFVQQNAAIMQQQTRNGGVNSTGGGNIKSVAAADQDHGPNQGTVSPPDTTTHSPRSPERPPSERSGGSDMVQCVSSSEPDSVVSLAAADSAQSPSTTNCDRSNNTAYQPNITNLYKPSGAKIRRVEISPQYNNAAVETTILQDPSCQVAPDSHESSSSSPIASSTSLLSSTLVGGSTAPGIVSTIGNSTGGSNGTSSDSLPSFSIGQLVWGAARGHPAWPGKIVNPPPDGACISSDSTWVQWFGGRSNPEPTAVLSLKTLSEGLEAHHKAQKDTRKSRKLNQQLERAIHEAMVELDRIAAMAYPTSTTQNAVTGLTGKSKSRGRQLTTVSTLGYQRTKPIRIAPAPPCITSIQQHIQHQPGLHHSQYQQLQSNQQQNSQTGK